jgi:hypothetical protein
MRDVLGEIAIRLENPGREVLEFASETLRMLDNGKEERNATPS